MSKNYIFETDDETQFILEIGVNSTGAAVITTHHASYLTPYTEPDTEKVRKEVCDKCMNETEDLAYQLYSPKVDEAYQRGLNDAWDAARTLWNMPNTSFNSVITTLTAQEAIEEIRQHEKAQEEQEQEQEIKVGVELEAVAGKAVIIEVLNNGKDVRYMYHDASIGFNDSCDITRTGRYFPEIAEVLRKMKE